MKIEVDGYNFFDVNNLALPLYIHTQGDSRVLEVHICFLFSWIWIEIWSNEGWRRRKPAPL